MSSTQIILSQFKNTMYKSSLNEGLSTGDIVRLNSESFKNILRYPAIQSVLDQYLRDPNYVSGLWVVLNQPCDMVHDESTNRQMKSSLFLAPLQGLRAALKKGIPTTDVLHFISAPNVSNTFETAYQKFLSEVSKNQNPMNPNEKPADYNKRIQTELVHPVITMVQKTIEPLKEMTDHPEDLLETLIEATIENRSINESLVSFKASDFWIKAKEKFDLNREQVVARSKVIILKSNSEDAMAKLCLNQLDSQGVFFFEPHATISSSETDLAFIIKLDDLLTLKIDKTKLENGELYKVLIENRLLSLTENFSDRLLNIMGNYFSKIGTNDVMSSTVLDMYTKVFPDSFFLSDAKYTEYSQKNASSSKI